MSIPARPLVGATRPEESAHPELWEGLVVGKGMWHFDVDGNWSLDFDGRGAAGVQFVFWRR